MTTRSYSLLLPYSAGQVLLQLRDDNPAIPFPGSWGFFGGAIEHNETADAAAVRELDEELKLSAADLKQFYVHTLDVTPGENPQKQIIYAYCFQLAIPVDQISLHEGQDCALATLEEIYSLRLYSAARQRYFPLAGTAVMPFLVERLSEHLKWR